MNFWGAKKAPQKQEKEIDNKDKGRYTNEAVKKSSRKQEKLFQISP